MSGLFQGLEIDKGSRLTQQLDMFTASHRIAHVNTPVCAQERATTGSTVPLELPGGRTGSGGTTLSVNQLRGGFIDVQFRREYNALGAWQVQHKVLNQIKRVFTEPQDHTLGELMTRFWNSWQQQAHQPSSASRTAVIEQADLLINGLRTAALELNNLDSEPEKPVTTKNEMDKQIARDAWLPESREALDRLAQTLVTEVNSLHCQGLTADGRTGQAFFDPRYVTADKIQLHSAVADNPQQNIVAGRTATHGDVEIAQALADLADTPVLPDGRTTLNGYWDAVVTSVGMRSMEAQDVIETQSLLIAQLANHRQSVMGASLDEVLAEMIRFQHAYEAAARVITSMDEAIDTVVNGMSLVGR